MAPSFVFARVILHSEALKVQRRQKLFEFLMMLFQCTDNPGRELKLQNVQLLSQ